MASKSMWSKVGVWSFVAGLVIAIICALMFKAVTGPMVGILGALGVLVGLLNVTDDEIQLFLLASLVILMAATSMGAVMKLLPEVIGGPLTTFFAAIAVFTAPAGFIVGVVALYHIAKDE